MPPNSTSPHPPALVASMQELQEWALRTADGGGFRAWRDGALGPAGEGRAVVRTCGGVQLVARRLPEPEQSTATTAATTTAATTTIRPEDREPSPFWLSPSIEAETITTTTTTGTTGTEDAIVEARTRDDFVAALRRACRPWSSGSAWHARSDPDARARIRYRGVVWQLAAAERAATPRPDRNSRR
ncbi:hypothetical protein SAMD00023353_1301720 [Rosellinia necatrix]|uniref:Uncharacterized protein n=1 Tax=Rosellinia necatrix TaxID=77044 RepID=A0A1S8A6T5_ROSNE|nr:hypothetical protein SAMD00023353_1301720 [Rosellinia necatrix]